MLAGAREVAAVGHETVVLAFRFVQLHAAPLSLREVHLSQEPATHLLVRRRLSIERETHSPDSAGFHSRDLDAVADCKTGVEKGGRATAFGGFKAGGCLQERSSADCGWFGVLQDTALYT